MNHNPAALTVKRPEKVGSDKKNISFESAMVGVGSLVTYLAAAAVKRTAFLAKKAAVKILKGASPMGRKLRRSAESRVNKIRKSFARRRAFFSELKKKFHDRKDAAGFGTAFRFMLSDLGDSVKNSRKLVGTVVNYTVPVVCAAFLVCVVSDKASADYGVTVEYNGQEIGVVSEEAVLDSAQEVIADRAAYYDTGSDTYITATLSLKPLGAQDEVVNEQMLADAIQEQIDILPEEPAQETEEASETAEEAVMPDVQGAGEEANGTSADEAIGREEDGRERAFVVTVDGEVIGAVKENSDIEEFINEIKSEYEDDEDVVDVSFDKDIEYTYEQFVDPEDIVDEQEIIEKLDSNVAEPVYYEIQKGDNPWNIAHANGMTTDELNDCVITFDGEQIDDITEYCPVGAVVQLSEEVPYLQVLTTKEVEYNETIDYDTITTEDPDMYKGDSVVESAGIEGEKKVTALVTYKGGVPVSTDVTSEIVLSEPVTQYMRVGTRETTTPVSTGSGGSGEYFWPVDGGYISAYQGDGRGHKGIDIAAPYGTPIYAAESGTVIETGDGWNGGYGNCVRIQHDDGNITVYAHQSSIAISYGDYVVKGQLIGYVGSTGDSTGNHLHFEVRSYGTYANPLDYVSQS